MLNVLTDEEKAKRAKIEAEIATVEAKFQARPPELAAGQAVWEREASAGPPEWTVLTPETMESAGGATLTKQADGSILAGGANPAKDVFTITAKTDLKHITGFRLEALTDPSLPSNGPGRAGNFVLSAFKVKAAQAEKHFRAAAADFEQQGQTVAASIAGKNVDVGWAISPQTGKDHSAVFALEAPLDGDGPMALTFTLDQSSQYGQHVLGKFRLSATSAKDPLGGPKLPDDVRAALAAPAEKRSAAQRDRLADYYTHEVAPELAAERTQLAGLKKQLAEIVPATVPILRELPADQRRRRTSSCAATTRRSATRSAKASPPCFRRSNPAHRGTASHWRAGSWTRTTRSRPAFWRIGSGRRFSASASCGPARISARRGKRRSIPNCWTGWPRKWCGKNGT